MPNVIEQVLDDINNARIARPGQRDVSDIRRGGREKLVIMPPPPPPRRPRRRRRVPRRRLLCTVHRRGRKGEEHYDRTVTAWCSWKFDTSLSLEKAPCPGLAGHEGWRGRFAPRKATAKVRSDAGDGYRFSILLCCVVEGDE